MNIPYSSIHFLWKVADWVYPPVCAGCKKDGFRFCPDCLSNVRFLRGSYCLSCGRPVSGSKKICHSCSKSNIVCNDMVSLAEFEGPIRKAIHNLKYNRDMGLGDFFAPFLIDLLMTRQWSFNMVIPVPISNAHKKSRGFNQSELISRPIASYFQIPHSVSALRRVKETESQTQLSADERFQNMKDAFFGNPAKLKGKRILVVDDIITTGATMNQCAIALFNAGAEEVYGLSIAKTVRERH